MPGECRAPALPEIRPFSRPQPQRAIKLLPHFKALPSQLQQCTLTDTAVLALAPNSLIPDLFQLKGGKGGENEWLFEQNIKCTVLAIAPDPFMRPLI